MYLARKAQPVANKKLHEAEVKRRQDLLKTRIATVKPSIDTRPPPERRHLHRNAKKEAMMEDRYAKIEHDNRLLLTKMSDIMTRPAGTDTINSSWQYGHSLNRTQRSKEMTRISKENLRILNRIQSVQPLYSHVKWEEERIKQEKLLESIAEYKPSIYGKTSPRGSGSLYRHDASYAGGYVEEGVSTVLPDARGGAGESDGPHRDYSSSAAYLPATSATTPHAHAHSGMGSGTGMYGGPASASSGHLSVGGHYDGPSALSPTGASAPRSTLASTGAATLAPRHY